MMPITDTGPILVTGGGGFLGQAIVRQLLARGNAVRILARGDYPDLVAAGAELQRGDIRQADTVLQAAAGCSAVIHTAAIAGIWGPRQKYYEINTLGTEHVLSACRTQQIQRLVFTSSPSVTFAGTDQAGVNESVPYPTQWLCAYPETKALAEQAVLAANDGQQLRTVALRPHLIWGPGDPHLIPRLIERARAGQLRRVGNGQNLIDMIYIDNAALGHLQALDALEPGAKLCGQAYFLSQGEPVNCWDWINQILALVDVPPIQKSISTNAAWYIGAILEQVHRLFRRAGEPRMTRFLAAQLGYHHYYDISRARHDFGYTPTISTVDGMQRLRDWLLND
jgi:2-alkyl-3-oxoalkanoate reductase